MSIVVAKLKSRRCVDGKTYPSRAFIQWMSKTPKAEILATGQKARTSLAEEKGALDRH